LGKLKGKFNKQQLTEAFMEFHNENDRSCFYHLLPLLSTIIDYSEQLEHLDTLLSSFQSFHKKDNEIKLTNE
jgi:hypothetical protein